VYTKNIKQMVSDTSFINRRIGLLSIYGPTVRGFNPHYMHVKKPEEVKTQDQLHWRQTIQFPMVTSSHNACLI